MNIQFNFDSRNVVVTGGAQGIGLQIAKDFLSSKANVVIWDWSEEALAKARTELKAFAPRVHFRRVDISKFDECQAAAAELPFPLHVLVNNAGITRDKTITKMTAEDWSQVIGVNLNGAFHVVKTLLDKFDPAFPQKRIINMASVVALYGNFGQANYAAAKAGLVGLTKTLSRELGRKGFTVNAVAPGFTLTPMVEAMPQEVLKQMEQRVPVQRLGKTQDISAACLFLASEEAGYMNGSVVSVDGGLVC